MAEITFPLSERFGLASLIVDKDSGAVMAARLMRRRMSLPDVAPAAAWLGDCAARGIEPGPPGAGSLVWGSTSGGVFPSMMGSMGGWRLDKLQS